MSHKVHPRIFRIGTIYEWSSRWFARPGKGGYAEQVREDHAVRTFIRKQLREAGVDDVKIERAPGEIVVHLVTARPGVIIGRGGAGAEELRKKVQEQLLHGTHKVKVNITEVGKPSLSATIVAQGIAQDLERRMPFRRVMKQAIERVQKAGAHGVRVMLGGRLNGAEIARREKLSWGKIPLQNLRADIDFALVEANTIYGVIGVKVWIYRGEIFAETRKVEGASSPT